MGKEEKKKMEQKDELTNSGQRFPVEQVSNTGKPTKKQVKAAVKELNPDVNSLGSRGFKIENSNGYNWKNRRGKPVGLIIAGCVLCGLVSPL